MANIISTKIYFFSEIMGDDEENVGIGIVKNPSSTDMSRQRMTLFTNRRQAGV